MKTNVSAIQSWHPDETTNCIWDAQDGKVNLSHKEQTERPISMEV